ncbi:hypothetical protein HN784_02670 [bacterium]|nr:hypothetical protein [bacterium]MBT4250835.1 hypothetical protein [bacterium]MBT6754013.1 hypothetical protein [bacterium]MBT7431717.1 hypothetical protein [bacterium]MBT7992715.1 hypothetical protein [bacterium]
MFDINEIERRATVAKKKLLAGIKASFAKREYEKIFGRGLIDSYSQKTLIKSFSFLYENELKMPTIKTTGKGKYVMLGFFLLQTEKNFLTDQELIDLRRAGFLEELLVKDLSQEDAINKVFKKYSK